jgi:adenylate cyclase
MYYSPRVCELVGLQASELRTMTDWTDRIHPDDRQPFKKAILAHFKGETDRLDVEYRYRHADSSWHWARQHGIALKNEAGRAYRVVGSTGDITDRKAAEEALLEALEQQTATAEVMQVINSSPGDLAPVFNAILEKAHSLCGADFGALKTYDGEFFRHAAARSPSASARYRDLMGTDFRPGVGSVWARLVSGERFVHDFDLAEVAARASQGRAPHLEALVEIGIRTQLIVPLRKDDRLLGAISANRREVRPFSDKQIALLENFAAQAVIAMENARLITETREALEQQTATAEVLGVINSSPGDLPPVFDAMVERAVRLCEADAATVRTFDGELLHLAAAHAEPRMMEELLQLGPSHLNWLYEPLSRGERVIHIPDVRETAAYREIPSARERLDRRGIRSWLAVALCKDRALLGILNVHRRDVRPFSDKQIALLENFAAQAVVAMENARLLGELRQRTEEVAELNRGLEARVAEQVEELGRVGRLKRFLAPQLAELIVSQGDEKILESHRREIVVVFCDLRDYTAFTETAEPEEVLDFLREYHGALGPLVSQFEGTLDQFSGDGIMVFFNDPVPCPDPAERAVRMAMAMREAAGTLIASWRRRGRLLGFGAGIAQGYATLGQIGFAERSGYTAIGTVCNLAARLCAEAQDGQILIGQRVAVAVEQTITLEEVGALTLKGLTQPVVAYNVPLAAAQPALRVIEGGPQGV